MKRIYSALVLALGFYPITLYATVGGPEHVDILGADPVDQKIYFLRHYNDESGRLPTLYYFLLNGKSPEKPIEVKSIYTKMNSRNYEAASQKTLDEIAKIQKRLKPIVPVSKQNSQLKIIHQNTQLGHYWLNAPEEKVTKQTVQYQIYNRTNRQKFQSAKQNLINYQNKPIQINYIYQTPKKMKQAQIAVIQYLGIPTETGYIKEDAVLLIPQE
ncbi:aminotransferase [Acinetobacter shaoyimingii]|uniref:Aminotransferase n=1 Tax=Acinetobacter shaoyimingii TaxID=2715164 RepID=A0A6G8RWC4_9GAMM|nr:aminotransferase [Acinetobacter shaoyimingii]QIO06023.1 aminotransferase [Acinetobacter shaoyimingii]